MIWQVLQKTGMYLIQEGKKGNKKRKNITEDIIADLGLYKGV
jgi:hypothetical protein